MTHFLPKDKKQFFVTKKSNGDIKQDSLRFRGKIKYTSLKDLKDYLLLYKTQLLGPKQLLPGSPKHLMDHEMKSHI